MIVLTAAAILASTPTGVASPQTELTIYNQGFGLVKETRHLALKKGRQMVAIEDVASSIDPTSVGFRSLSNPDGLSILEQNYQYDLISSQAILEKSVGQKVRFIRTIGNQRDVLEGILLSSPTAVVASADGSHQKTYNGMVIRTDDGRVVLDPTGEVEVKTVPPGLISRPTLLWDVDSSIAGDNTVELSYITQGLGWNADYVLTIDGSGKGDIQGWVTLNNSSGATWENAKLKLLAGDVHRAATRPTVTMFKAAARTAGQAQFEEESLFEYHLYTLQRPATVRNHETKQVSLLEGHDIPVTEKLIIDSISSLYYPNEGEVGTGDVKPQVRLEFVNSKESGLGIPLPKGKVRVYERDKSGSVQLLGEDQIDHTPRGELVSLVVGRSFDVVSTRKRTDFKRINDRSVEETFEIEIRNRKEVPAQVTVLERHYGDWNIREKNTPFTKPDSNTAQFAVDLKANETKKIIYTVDTKW